MLKTSSAKSTKPKKGGIRVSGDSRAGRDRSELVRDDINSNEVGNNEVEKKVQKTFKSKKLSKFKKMVGSDFFTPGARLVFTKLRKAFLKALIVHHFDPEHHIPVETDTSGYAIGRVFSQLPLDDLGQ